MTAHTRLIGVDESGTGALAGPITVAAVYVPPEKYEELTLWGWNDSKKLTSEKCAELHDRLIAEGEEMGVAWTVTHIEPIVIDTISPKDAWMRGARSAIMLTTYRMKCRLTDISVLIDGRDDIGILPTFIPRAMVPRADRQFLPVMIASVLAKHTRDNDMRLLHGTWPLYNFAVNKGYPTLEHLTMLLKVGPVYGVHRKHYLRKVLLAHYDKYMRYVWDPPWWLVRGDWLRNVEDKGVVIETTWPLIDPLTEGDDEDEQ